MTDLFVYGSLQLPEVLSIVIGHIPQMILAQAPGWKACRLPGVHYPGLIANQGSLTTGIVLQGIDAKNLAALDDFEGTQYNRESITVYFPDDTSAIVDTYVLADNNALPEIWKKSQLLGSELTEFLTQSQQWRHRYDTLHAEHPHTIL